MSKNSCPKCGSSDIVMLLVHRTDGQSQFKCNACGNEWLFPDELPVRIIVCTSCPNKCTMLWMVNNVPLPTSCLHAENAKGEAVWREAKDGQ